jgi:spore germination protein KC
VRKYVSTIWLIPLLTLLSGCWDRTELNDLALVTVMGFDKGENNQVLVSAQVIIPQNQSGAAVAGGGGGGSSGKRTIMRSEQGINIADALSKLQRKLPRKLFWGQCKAFIFSESLAKEGIQEHFDFLVRHPQPRERAYLFISKGKAADILELYPPIERSTSEVLQELSNLQNNLKVTMERLSIQLKSEFQSFALPLITILPEAKSSQPFQTIAYIYGSAIFKQGKMIGEMTEKSTRGILWLKNEITEYTVTYKTLEEEGFISLRPVKGKVKLLPTIEGEQWKMMVKVSTEGSIVQNGTNLNPLDPGLLALMETSLENDIKERIQKTLQEIQHKWKADVVDFAKTFHMKYPKQWESVKDRWNEKFPEITTDVQVEAHILRPGLVNAPGGMPIEDVKNK